MEENSVFDEWIPLSDMLACCVAVLLMIILIIEQKSSIAQVSGADGLRNALVEIAKGSNGAINFYDGTNYYKLVLDNATFDLGSPELTRGNRNLILSKGEEILSVLLDSSFIMRIEGHADANPLNSLSQINITSPKLTRQYDYDNTLLSLLRAMEVKRVLAEHWKTVSKLPNEELKIALEKVSVSGYGANRPINREDPKAPENRRVEIYFEQK